MRALVTGCDGFIGANLCQELAQRGHQVTGAALSRRGETSLEALGVRCRVEYGDVTDAGFVERLVGSSEPDWVFHLAAVSIVRRADMKPAVALRTNILGTLNVLEACRDSRAQRVLVASSDKAYGDHGGQPYREDDPLLPTGPYEVSKACADHIVRLYARHGLPAAVVRCANVYGPGDLNWSRLVPGACRRAIAGQAPQVYGQNAAREWIDVGSVCDAYIALAEAAEIQDAYNVGTGETATALDVASMIAGMLGAPDPERVDEPGWYEIPAQVTDATRLRRLGWRPRPCGMGVRLQHAALWYRRHLGAGDREAVPA